MRYNLNPTALLALVPLTPEPKANRLKLLPIRFRPDGVGMATDGHVMGFYTGAITPQEEGESLPSKGLTVLALNGWKPILSALKRSKGRVPAVLDTEANTLTVYSQKHAPAPFVVALDPEGFPEDGALLQCVPRPDTRATLPALTVNPDLLARFGTDRLTLTFTGAGRGILVQTPDPDFFGVVMPCKDAAPIYANGHTEPDWLRDAYGNLARAQRKAA